MPHEDYLEDLSFINDHMTHPPFNSKSKEKWEKYENYCNKNGMKNIKKVFQKWALKELNYVLMKLREMKEKNP